MSDPPAAAQDGRAGDGAWLELAVTCDPEAVEAVSEILARVAPGGVSVEPGFTLVDEGLGAAVDPSAPATVRAYLPARDKVAARGAVDEVDRALGHLQAFGLREIGELRTRIVHEADWATAWKRHVGVLRIGRRIVIRPTWRRHRRQPGDVVIAMDPGMAFGTGLHPTTRLCLAGIERWADEGLLGSPAADRSGHPAEQGQPVAARPRPASRRRLRLRGPRHRRRAARRHIPRRRRHRPDRDRGDAGECPAQPGRPPPPGLAGLAALRCRALRPRRGQPHRVGSRRPRRRPGGRAAAGRATAGVGDLHRPRVGGAGRLRGRGPPRPPARCRGRLGGPGGVPTARVDGRARISRSRSGRR